MSLNCQHSDQCAACPWILLPYAEQRQKKIQALSQKLKAELNINISEINYVDIGESALRDRADLIVFEKGLGLYTQSKDLFSINECPQLSPVLFDFFQQIKAAAIRFKNPSQSKGSIRLRVSPSGKKGMWLDFSNQDIQFLFEEKKTLHRLLDLGFVEIGQRHKKLGWDEEENRFRLTEPEFHTWTHTWSGEQEIPLFSVVGGFSQSSHHSNRQIILKMSQFFSSMAKGGQWLEFGSGNGNLTLPLAHSANHVLGLEYEGLAAEGFQKTLSNLPAEVSKKIEIKTGNFHRSIPELFAQKSISGLLANPPRSGLKDFLNPLFDQPLNARPEYFFYMSCFMDSFLIDAQKMMELGYQLKELCILDQFPQSSHFEILSAWKIS